MKRTVFIIGIILISLQISGQRKGLSISGGIGTYNLSEVTLYQESLFEREPVEVKGITTFPPYTNLQVNYLKALHNNISLGILFNYSITGAHANYSDYSGYLNIDQQITGLQVGVNAGYPLLNIGKFSLAAKGDIRLGITRDRIIRNVVTTFYFDSQELKLSATSPMLCPSFEGLFDLGKLSLGFDAGYLFDVGGEFKDTGKSGQSVELRPTTPVKSNLSGLRAGLKIVLWFDQISLAGSPTLFPGE